MKNLSPLLVRLSIVLSSILLCSTVSAAKAPPNPQAEGLSDGERLEVLLERVQYEQEALETLRSDFSMVQESEMLMEPETSSGRFYFQTPDKVRWDYQQPNPMSVVIDGGSMTTWYRDLGKAEQADVGRYSDRVLQFMNASSSMAGLLEYFDARVRFGNVGEEPYEIGLTPAYDRVARRIRSITLWIDPERYLPVKVRIETPAGDMTQYEFSGMELNPALDTGRFDLQLPDEVELRKVQLSPGESGEE